MKNKRWKPLSEKNLTEIKNIFHTTFPDTQYKDLGDKISDYWINKLHKVWKKKSDKIKIKDKKYRPLDPLSRIQQKTVVIAYADSVKKSGEKSLNTLDRFLGKYFPAVGGLHMLPACTVAESRFNDGFFSQVVRDKIHEPFGTNRKFSSMMEKYYSMADFVLNHVDINNPAFQDFLNGNDAKKDCFYIFTEEEYQQHLANGDFDNIFRPRPFPLFTIFRRKPQNNKYKNLTHAEKVAVMKSRFQKGRLSEPLISLLSIFNKIKNDQMLLFEDYRHITNFRNYLKKHTSVDPDAIFIKSIVQETQHIPYIFNARIKNIENLLSAAGLDSKTASVYAENYRKYDPDIFGEEIRALTTFSHVQVDLNTATFSGLKMLADDFSWYLSLDLNMLRLDAANFAFKKWKTTCFGLPEVKGLMKVLYLSIDCVSPRIVANLEVNDTLDNILSQMADKKSPPPMMYDFHLASILPAVFNQGNAKILPRISKKLSEYHVSKKSIRFSLAESHDGKSVRGSLDILSLSERQNLADEIEKNGGRVKYKGVPQGQISYSEFKEVCKGAGLNFKTAQKSLFQKGTDLKDSKADSVLYLEAGIKTQKNIAGRLNIRSNDLNKKAVFRFFINKVLNGREPYELCVSTRDAMIRSENQKTDAVRHLAFYTLAFALMGRNVKSIYFNDLLGLPNDYERFGESGELRDLKRKKCDYSELEKKLSNTASLYHKIAKGINHIIAIVDSDPALNFRGNEAKIIAPSGKSFPATPAVIHNSNGRNHSLAIVNVKEGPIKTTIDVRESFPSSVKTLYDNIAGLALPVNADSTMDINLKPYQRLWLSKKKLF